MPQMQVTIGVPCHVWSYLQVGGSPRWPCRRLLMLAVLAGWLGSVSPLSAWAQFRAVMGGLGGKVAVGDFNNDGWSDIYAGGTLYRNDSGTFSPTAIGGPLSGDGVWGDYDKDGYLDFFSYNTGTLWHNEGGTNFRQMMSFSGMPQVSRGAAWGDFNGDSRLDLYVGGYQTWPSPNYSDAIYTNNGHTFTKTWTQGNDGVTTPGRPRPARGVTTADWDQDGDLDVYVSNYRLEPNALWRNNGSGQFTDVAGSHNARATSSGYAGGHSIGSVFGDFNDDGLIDLFAGNFSHPGQPQSRFLKNLGSASDYRFQDKGTGGVHWQESYASPTAGDIDNDGDLDLFFTAVYGGDYPRLYRNNGNFSFTDVTSQWGLADRPNSYKAAFLDYDDDGYLDLIHHHTLYQNLHNATNRHWLKVELDGNGSLDASAIGAQLRIDLGNGRILTRQVESAVGEGNQNDVSEVHFGLGSYNGPVEVEVRWPGQHVQTIDVPFVDQTISVQYRFVPEPSSLVLLLGGLAALAAGRSRRRRG